MLVFVLVSRIRDQAKPNTINYLVDQFNAGQDAVTRYALKLAPLVIVRPVELRQAEWTEFSLADGEWRIPAKKMKRSRHQNECLRKSAFRVGLLP